MYRQVFEEFNRICVKRGAGGAVLEIGAVAADDTLLCLPALKGASSRIGINLNGPHRYRDFEIVGGNANAMPQFKDGTFDTVLTNATLEHDPHFWQALAEIRRVTKPGGLVVIGTPGYAEPPPTVARKLAKAVARSRGLRRLVADFLSSTPTLNVHNYPGDYYRFSAQAFQEVFFEGYGDVKIVSVMTPPRIIGSGIRL